MDIHCKHCGEPWDIGELHDMLDEAGELLPFDEARERFYKHGCGAWDGATCTHPPITSPERLEGIAMMQELLGDDVDGLAASADLLPLADRDAGSDDWTERYPILGAIYKAQHGDDDDDPHPRGEDRHHYSNER